jgi:CBS-domain-containing membrane protein
VALARFAFSAGDIPFATSIALVIGSPDAEPAQPLVGGHVVATLVGLAKVKLTGPSVWAAAAAVGLAIVAMYLTDTFHPPAGIAPLLVVPNGLPWSFLLAPVLAGALLLTARLPISGTAGCAAGRGRGAGCNGGR